MPAFRAGDDAGVETVTKNIEQLYAKRRYRFTLGERPKEFEQAGKFAADLAGPFVPAPSGSMVQGLGEPLSGEPNRLRFCALTIGSSRV